MMIMKQIKVNPGYRIEKEMKRWFKGKSHPFGCVDFQTSSSLYEIKSCKLILNCSNNYHLIRKDREKMITTQLGRFFVEIINHNLLMEISEKENKIPKYIFAVVVGKQKIWKSMSWEEVDKLLDKSKRRSWIRIHQIFKRELELK